MKMSKRLRSGGWGGRYCGFKRPNQR